MNIRLYVLSVLVFPLVATAQVYKWKAKDGVVRYTDTPPPSNIKQETLKTKVPSAPVSAVKAGSADDKKVATDPKANDEMAAEKRRFEEENAKNKAMKKDAEDKANQENCKLAKANLQNYTEGGRIYKRNEKGEREYLDDKALADGAVQAKKDIETYCK